MKRTVMLACATALGLGLGLGQGAFASECLNLNQVIQRGPFSGDEFKLRNGTGLTLKMADFWSMANPPTASQNLIEMQPTKCFGVAPSLRLNNATLNVFLTDNPTGSAQVNINFCEFGGHHNVSARDASPADYIEDVRGVDSKELPDMRGDDVLMEVSMGSDILNSAGVRIGYEAKLIYNAKNPLELVSFGGQETFIHSICVN